MSIMNRNRTDRFVAKAWPKQVSRYTRPPTNLMGGLALPGFLCSLGTRVSFWLRCLCDILRSLWFASGSGEGAELLVWVVAGPVGA